MSSKKKHRKKHHKLKNSSVRQESTIAMPNSDKVAAIEEILAVKPPLPQADVPHLRLIQKDVRKVVILAGGFVIFQIALWYVFNNTPLGSTVYRLIQF